MFRNPRRSSLIVSLLLTTVLAFSSSTSQSIEKKEKTSRAGKPVIWADPGAVERLDFVGGPGGRANAPKPPFIFIEESLSGSNPKIRVEDARGKKWTVKFGSEVHAETFATRVAWASGYFVEPAYFVPSGRVLKLGKLKRGKSNFTPDGGFADARFEMRHGKEIIELDDEKSWAWNLNPFANSKELNGLKVIVMLTSNWDNKDVRDVKRGSNTAILRVPTRAGREDRYLISDWGGSMGKWGNFFCREKWDPKGFHKQTRNFIKGVDGNFVEFGFSGQHTSDFKNDIRVSDLKWLLQYVGRITDRQLRAGLQASGASPVEVEYFAPSMRDRINQMERTVGYRGGNLAKY
jgi:hypothetical protein